MQILLDRIRKDGVVKAGNVLKVDRFLNHQMDIGLFREIGKEFKRRFADTEINKILTIEASGIGIACIVARRRQRRRTSQGMSIRQRWNLLLMERFMTSLCQRNFWARATRFS